MAEKFVKTRDLAIGLAGRILEFATKASAQTSVHDLKGRLDKLETTFSSVSSMEENLWKYPECPSRIAEYEDIYFEARTKLLERIAALTVDETDTDLNKTLGEFVQQQSRFYENWEANKS